MMTTAKRAPSSLHLTSILTPGSPPGFFVAVTVGVAYNDLVKKSFVNPPIKFAVIATDVVLFTVKESQLLVRLIAVNRPPYFPAGSKGMPGGLIDPKETAEAAARRHLTVKAKISHQKIYLEQLYTFSAVDRDPRGRVVAVAYIALVPWANLSETEQQSDEQTWWAEAAKVGKLAYDHNEVLKLAIERLRSRSTYTTIISKLMPKVFSFRELELTFNCLQGKALDRRNLYKKIQKLNILTSLEEKRVGEPNRPAQLFKFSSQNIEFLEVI